MGRIWRVGQLRECTIFRMYASNSIEERILEIQRNKENLSDTIIDGKKATESKGFSDEVITTLFEYRDDEDKGLKSMDDEMVEHISKALMDLPNVEEHVQFYSLKITENKDDKIINEFDIREKGEEVPDSEDDGE